MSNSDFHRSAATGYGPCVICGDTNYSLSCGGPTICPKCDCGNFDAATVMKQAKVIADLREQLSAPAQPTPDTIAIDAKLLHSLWCYGTLAPVEGVVYSYGTHQKCLHDVDDLIAAHYNALAAQPPAAPVETERKTFTIPPGHEAVRDSEGRATGEVRPRLSADNGGEK